MAPQSGLCNVGGDLACTLPGSHTQTLLLWDCRIDFDNPHGTYMEVGLQGTPPNKKVTVFYHLGGEPKNHLPHSPSSDAIMQTHYPVVQNS